MFKKSQYLFKLLGLLTIIFVLQLAYLFTTEASTKEQIQLKNSFVKTTSLPDLAISSEAPFVRHRSLATAFDTYRDDSALLEYYPSTFIYKANR